jgi:hypothetical protein
MASQYYTHRVLFRSLRTGETITWKHFTSASEAVMFHKNALMAAKHYTVTLERITQ